MRKRVIFPSSPWALLAALALTAGCQKSADPTGTGNPGGAAKPAEPPVGWSLQEVDLAQIDRSVGPAELPARMYVGGKPKLYKHGEGNPDEYRRLADRLQKKGNYEAHFWAWEDGGRVYAVMRTTAGTTATPPPKGDALVKFQTEGFLSGAESGLLQIVSRKPVTRGNTSGAEAVLDGRGLRIVARVLVNPQTERMYLFEVSAVKQSDPIDGDDPKVRAFLDNSEPPAGKK